MIPILILIHIIITAVLAVYIVALKSWLNMLTIEVERLKIVNVPQSVKNENFDFNETTIRMGSATVTLKPSSPVRSSFFEGGLI